MPALSKQRVYPRCGRAVRWAAARIAVCGVLLAFGSISSSAHAATLSGPSEAPMSTSVTLAASYADGTAAACEVNGYPSMCSGYLNPAGDPFPIGKCSLPNTSCDYVLQGITAAYEVEDPTSESLSRTYTACDGVLEGCAAHTVTWTPWPVTLSGRAATPASDGTIEVTIRSEDSLPPGELALYDMNSQRYVSWQSTSSADPCSLATPMCAATFVLPSDACSGPYFRGDYLTRTGKRAVSTSIFRVNGIADAGIACNDDPPTDGGGSGGSGGGSGGSGGNEEPPAPPRAELHGPTSMVVPDEEFPLVSPSAPTEYPYELVVRDLTDNGRVVGNCMARTSCNAKINPDFAALEPVVHRLVAETRLAGEVVREGDEMSFTVYPLPARPRIQKLAVREPDDFSLSAGIVDLRLSNAERRAVAGYQLHLEVRYPDADRPRWTREGDCGTERLRCDIPYSVGTQRPGTVQRVMFRSVLTLSGTVVKRSAPLTLSLVAGLDWEETAPLLEASGFCGAIIAMNPSSGPTPNYSTVREAAMICATTGSAAAAALVLLAGGLTDAIPLIMTEISKVTSSITVPASSGGTTTTTGQAAAEEAFKRIGENLRRLNPDRLGALAGSTATAIGAACTAAFAFQFVQQAIGFDGLGSRLNPRVAFFIVGADAQEAAKHNLDAILGTGGLVGLGARPQWFVLNYESTAAKRASQGRRDWYRPSATGPGGPCASVSASNGLLQCDEYPYYSSQQGGKFAVPTPSLRAVSAQDNQREGQVLGGFYTRCGMTDSQEVLPTATANGRGGARYLVLPMPEIDTPLALPGFVPHTSPVTVGLCNKGAGGGVG